MRTTMRTKVMIASLSVMMAVSSASAFGFSGIKSSLFGDSKDDKKQQEVKYTPTPMKNTTSKAKVLTSSIGSSIGMGASTAAITTAGKISTSDGATIGGVFDALNEQEQAAIDRVQSSDKGGMFKQGVYHNDAAVADNQMELKTVVVKQVVQQNVIQQTPASNGFRFISGGVVNLLTRKSNDAGWASIQANFGTNSVTIGGRTFIYDPINNKFTGKKVVIPFGYASHDRHFSIEIQAKGNELRYKTAVLSSFSLVGPRTSMKDYLLLKIDSKKKTLTYVGYSGKPSKQIRKSGEVVCGKEVRGLGFGGSIWIKEYIVTKDKTSKSCLDKNKNEPFFYLGVDF